MSLPGLSQTVSIPASGASSLFIAANETITVTDPGGSNNYPNNCNGTLTIYSSDSTTLRISGTIDIESGNDWLTLFAGTSSEAPPLNQYSGTATIDLWTNSNAVTLLFASDALVGASGFSLIITAVDTLLRHSSSAATPPPACIDFAMLTGEHTRASYGTYHNPRQQDGCQDFGPSSPLSRHTVHTDTSEYDPRTGLQLRCIPPGHTSSVRLGNWQSGGEAECITYSCRVDTSVSDLLIVRYAAVLQDPNHSSQQQPKFQFKILDTTFQEIDPACYSSTFVASQSLGWNSVSSQTHPQTGGTTVLWKDWTAVGVDLTALHGQTILVRLTSFDCSRNDHYGYAYFTLECAQKRLALRNCGPIAGRQITAPEGFSYNWHAASAPAISLSTERTLTINTPGTYICTLTSINPSCTFNLSATATERYPLALFDVEQQREGCTSRMVLHNRSGVGGTAGQQVCDTTIWIVDGTAMAGADSVVLDVEPGQHSVALVATLDEGCSDTALQTIAVFPPCVWGEADSSVCPSALPLIWNGISFRASGTQQITLTNAAMHGADSILTMTVFVGSNSSSSLHDTAVQNDLPRQYGGLIFNASQGDTTWTIANAAGCDSTICYSLHVWPNVEECHERSICDNELPLTWNGLTFTNGGTQALHLLTSHGADSTVTLTVHVDPTYSHTDSIVLCHNALPLTWGDTVIGRQAGTSANSYFTISRHLATLAGCDSMLTLALTIHPTFETTDSIVICHSALPLVWADTVIDTPPAGTQASSPASTHLSLCRRLATIDGCDSLLHLFLTIHPVYHYFDADTICRNEQPYIWRDTIIDSLPTGITTINAEFATIEGCDSLLTLTLLVNPTSHTWHRATVCDGLPYTWLDGNTYTQSTDQPVILASNRFGCDSITQLFLEIEDGFDARMAITPERVTPMEPEVTLRDLSKSGSRTWHFNGFTDTTRVALFQFPQNRDSVAVMMVARSYIGCVDTVRGMVVCDRSAIWLPNAFTPELETNNRFRLLGSGLHSAEIWIYNRAGLLVAHFDALNGSWDGTSHGTKCPQATYAYRLTYTTISMPNQQQEKRGTVTLLR